VLSGRGLCDFLIPCTGESYISVNFDFFIWLGSGLCVGLITCTEEPSGCQSVVSFVFCQRSLRRPDHLYRRVLWFSVCCECCVLSRRGLCGA